MRQVELSEGTKVPLSWIFGVISAAAIVFVTLVGGVAWLTNVASAQRSQGEEIREIKVKQDEFTKIRVDIAEIRVKVESIDKRLDSRRRQ